MLQTALAAVFALATLGTTLFTYGVPLLDPGSISADNLLAAAPGAALVAAVLAAHEAGHRWVRALSPRRPSSEVDMSWVTSDCLDVERTAAVALDRRPA